MKYKDSIVGLIKETISASPHQKRGFSKTRFLLGFSTSGIPLVGCRATRALRGARRTMMKEASEDEEQLRPANSSEDVPFVTHAVSPMWRSFAIAIVACVFGILAGVTFHSPRPPPPQPIIPGEGGGHHMHHHFVTEYDLVTIRYETPMAFETDVKGLGVTDKEYKACKSSILQDPNRKICTKANFKCYKKKLKYQPDANGDIQPTYVKEGATEIECPTTSSYGNCDWRNTQSCTAAQENSMGYSGWPSSCQVQLDGTNTRVNICYSEIPCEEEQTQWSAGFFQSSGGQYDYQWSGHGHPSWTGGLQPSNVTYPHATLTAQYEGKFCLQKAALKALSRKGWELIEPSEAFEAGYGSRGRDLYSSKTFKVIKRTLAM
jgi:hypothetical protein